MKVTQRATLTFVDGSTVQKELPPWATKRFSRKGSVEGETPEVKPKSKFPPHVYNPLKPILVTLTLTGVLPVYRLKIGGPKVQVLLGGGLCLVIYLFFAYLTYLVFIDTLDLILHDDDFGSIIYQVIVMMLLSQHLFYFVLTWPESIAVNRYLAQWREFQTQYELVTGSVLSSTSCHFRVSVWLVVVAISSAITTFIASLINSKVLSSYISYVVIFYQLFNELCFFLLWSSNGWAIIEIARQYYDHLDKECAEDISPERLEDFRLVWMKLTELVRAGTSMLSYTMAMIVTPPFTFEVIAAYNLTIYIIRSIKGAPLNLYEAVGTALAFLFYAFLLYIFCNSGYCITTECERVQHILLNHKTKTTAALPRMNTELRLFLRCLRSAPPLATLSGYVTINRKVFLHLTGVLVTYLIILVQFNFGSIHTEAGNKTMTQQLGN